MFKQKKDSTIERVYAVYDKMSGHFVDFCVARTDGLASRYFLSKLKFPIRDTELILLGEGQFFFPRLNKNEIIPADFNKFVEFNSIMKSIPWSCYKFPDSVADALAPLELSHDEIIEISNNKIKQFVENTEKKE